jgi:hypothetical protein
VIDTSGRFFEDLARSSPQCWPGSPGVFAEYLGDVCTVYVALSRLQAGERLSQVFMKSGILIAMYACQYLLGGFDRG